jgi:phosphate transport system permease protein
MDVQMSFATFHDIRRRVTSNLMTAFCAASILIALVPLAMILFFVVVKGAGALNWAFFTELPKPVGETGGGMRNAIAGTLMMCGLGAVFAIPVGVMSGVYIVESRARFAPLVRFAADALNGVPSIVIGVFIYVLTVVPFKHFSALAGGLALGVMMIPLITRTTEELLRLVPISLREGALALGATKSRAIFTVVLPAALPGIITGIVLALARIAGETAPLLFTALGSPYWSTDLTQPMASMTVVIYTYAASPYDDWHRQAWAGAFVLVAIVLVCSILVRLATIRLARMRVAD